MKLYITFGQAHAHSVNNKTFDKDSVAAIECDSYEHGRDTAFELFGDKFAFSHTEKEIIDKLHYFPRGIMEV